MTFEDRLNRSLYLLEMSGWQKALGAGALGMSLLGGPHAGTAQGAPQDTAASQTNRAWREHSYADDVAELTERYNERYTRLARNNPRAIRDDVRDEIHRAYKQIDGEKLEIKKIKEMSGYQSMPVPERVELFATIYSSTQMAKAVLETIRPWAEKYNVPMDAGVAQAQDTAATDQELYQFDAVTYKVDRDRNFYYTNDEWGSGGRGTVILHIPSEIRNRYIRTVNDPNSVVISGMFKFIRNVEGKNGFGGPVNIGYYEPAEAETEAPEQAEPVQAPREQTPPPVMGHQAEGTRKVMNQTFVFPARGDEKNRMPCADCLFLQATNPQHFRVMNHAFFSHKRKPPAWAKELEMGTSVKVVRDNPLGSGGASISLVKVLDGPHKGVQGWIGTNELAK